MSKHPDCPKFLICTNHMARPDERYIYHSQKPRFLALLTAGGVELVDDIDNVHETLTPDKLDGLMARMRDWVKAYDLNEGKNK